MARQRKNQVVYCHIYVNGKPFDMEHMTWKEREDVGNFYSMKMRKSLGQVPDPETLHHLDECWEFSTEKLEEMLKTSKCLIGYAPGLKYVGGRQVGQEMYKFFRHEETGLYYYKHFHMEFNTVICIEDEGAVKI